MTLAASAQAKGLSVQMSGSCHSISALPASPNAWLIAENGRLPKNPLRAERGDGCADLIILCLTPDVWTHLKK